MGLWTWLKNNVYFREGRLYIGPVWIEGAYGRNSSLSSEDHRVGDLEVPVYGVDYVCNQDSETGSFMRDD